MPAGRESAADVTPRVGSTIGDPTVSGTGGIVPISSVCRRARSRQPRIISRITNAISNASSAAMISDATSVPEFMLGSFRRGR
jgi:hypothetical protein